jgi:hypothetical protein
MYNFDFIIDISERIELKNGYETINKLELWDWLRAYDINNRFIVTDDPVMLKIMAAIDTTNHSIMYRLKYIADNGENAFKESYLHYIRIEHEKMMERRQITNQQYRKNIISRL